MYYSSLFRETEPVEIYFNELAYVIMRAVSLKLVRQASRLDALRQGLMLRFGAEFFSFSVKPHLFS